MKDLTKGDVLGVTAWVVFKRTESIMFSVMRDAASQPDVSTLLQSGPDLSFIECEEEKYFRPL